MIVLIVDDQVDVAQGVESGVNWQQLKIDCIRTANSMQEAQQVFLTIPVDIIISDIEMPMGNGLELITWVREKHPETECIFLTAHEDFEYAREAIKLGAFDYLIQPIHYDELEKVVARAIDKINLKSHKEELSLLGKYWQDNARNVRENFWGSIISGSYQQNSARLDAQAIQLGIAIKPPVEYLPILVSIIRRQIQLSEWDDDLLKGTFINLLEEIVFEQAGIMQVVQMDASHYVFLLPQTDDGPIEEMILLQKMRFFSNFCQANLKSSLAVYIGRYARIAAIADVYRQLTDLNHKNVANYSKVFTLNNLEESENHDIEITEIEHWAHLLDLGLSERVYSVVVDFFNRKIAMEEVDAAFLARFQNEFLQMIWQLSESRGVKNLDLMFNQKTVDHFLGSLDNVENMLAFVQNVVTIPLSPTITESDYKSTIEQVKAYIRDNLDRELSRNEIAEKVFLNPEYLSRLFRKQTGQSMIEFITSERINTAIGYLVRTNMPVSIIASKVGHSNFSHFSKIFKKVTGLTPNEYRQTHVRR